MPPATSTPQTLADLIRPLQPASFLRSSWGKRFIHLQGERGKFAGLMPWEALSGILADQALPHSEILLLRNRKLIPLPVHGKGVLQLKAPRFLEELTRGTTLVLNAAQVCYRPLRDLTEDLQTEFRAKTYANLYASWKAEPGFGLHRDEQHTLILQVAGRKRWTIYGPSERKPSSSARPLWSGTLADGDLLHIPVGFWHLPVSVNEPSLHLTVSVMPTLPGELLQWLAPQVLDAAKGGAHVPVVGSDVEKRRWIRRLRTQLAKACTDDVIERFLAEREAAVIARPRLALPALGPPRIGLDTPIRVVRARVHIVRAGPERVSLRCGDHTWTMSRRVLPLLTTLVDRNPHTLRELLKEHKLSGMAATVRALLRALAKQQVIVVG